MTTLRRELRKAILNILESKIRYFESSGDGITLGNISDMIADAILKIFFKDENNEHNS